jgi:hypothetical protein
MRSTAAAMRSATERFDGGLAQRLILERSEQRLEVLIAIARRERPKSITSRLSLSRASLLFATEGEARPPLERRERRAPLEHVIPFQRMRTRARSPRARACCGRRSASSTAASSGHASAHSRSRYAPGASSIVDALRALGRRVVEARRVAEKEPPVFDHEPRRDLVGEHPRFPFGKRLEGEAEAKGSVRASVRADDATGSERGGQRPVAVLALHHCSASRASRSIVAGSASTQVATSVATEQETSCPDRSISGCVSRFVAMVSHPPFSPAVALRARRDIRHLLRRPQLHVSEVATRGGGATVRERTDVPRAGRRTPSSFVSEIAAHILSEGCLSVCVIQARHVSDGGRRRSSEGARGERGPAAPGAADRVDLLVQAIREADALDWAVFDTSSLQKIDQALAMEPRLFVMPRVASSADVQAFLAKPWTPLFVEIDSALFPQQADVIRAAGLRTFTNVFGIDLAVKLGSDRRAYLAEYDKGADVLQTDLPDEVLRVLGRPVPPP